MSMLENYNYYMDRRTWGKINNGTFDEQKMTLTIELTIEDENGDEYEDDISFPAKFEICNLCQGRGKIVNPNIDAGGLTQEDFYDWDDSDIEFYKNGGYDISCTSCDGNRVIPIVDEQRLNEEQKMHFSNYEKHLRDEANYQRECAMERAMGA